MPMYYYVWLCLTMYDHINPSMTNGDKTKNIYDPKNEDQPNIKMTPKVRKAPETKMTLKMEQD